MMTRDAIAGGLRLGFTCVLGLMAGFFFAWSFSAMPGFAQVPAAVYIEAMQRINEAVRSVVFGATFWGPLVVGLAAFGLTRDPAGRRWLGAAWLLYLGAVAVTMTVNVPINQTMSAWQPAAPPAEWRQVLERWTAANHVRLALSLAAFLCGIAAVARPAKAEIN